MKDFLDVPQVHINKIPPELLHLACEPIIRGSMYGVAGNVKAVCEAREWASLYAGMENCPGMVMNGVTLDRWLDGLDGIEVEKLIYPDECDSEGFFTSKRDNEASLLPYICTSCEKPI